MGDRDEIEGLMLAYCRAIDSGDWEAFRALMGRALWLVEGQAPPPASANNVIVYEDGTPRTKHVITNIAILVDPEGDRAEGHSYVTVYQQIPADQLRTIFRENIATASLGQRGAGISPSGIFAAPLWRSLKAPEGPSRDLSPGPPLLGGPGDFSPCSKISSRGERGKYVSAQCPRSPFP